MENFLLTYLGSCGARAPDAGGRLLRRIRPTFLLHPLQVRRGRVPALLLLAGAHGMGGTTSTSCATDTIRSSWTARCRRRVPGVGLLYSEAGAGPGIPPVFRCSFVLLPMACLLAIVERRTVH
jgi:hypothetical protein